MGTPRSLSFQGWVQAGIRLVWNLGFLQVDTKLLSAALRLISNTEFRHVAANKALMPDIADAHS